MSDKNWVEKFLYELDDETEYMFISENANQISRSAYKSILQAYMHAMNNLDSAAKEEFEESIRDELETQITGF